MDVNTTKILTRYHFERLLANKWNWGKWSINDKGYPRFRSGQFRDKYVHRVIAEIKLGRKLRRDEDIDHINSNRLDFRWCNLRVLSHREHGRMSSKQRWYVNNKDKQEKQHWENYFNETTKETEETEQSFDTSFEVSSFGSD